MKLQGKYIGEAGSSFVEFKLKEPLAEHLLEECKEHGHEGVWQGKDTHKNFGDEVTLIIGFDYLEPEQKEILDQAMEGDEDSLRLFEDLYDYHTTVRF